MIKDTKKIIATISLSVAVFAASAITLEEAKTLYIKGKYEEALPAFKELYNKNPRNAKNASINQWLGVCLYKTGQHEESKKYFEFAASKSVMESNLYLSKLAFEDYRFEEAYDYIDTYTQSLSKLKKEVSDDVREYMAQTRAAKSMIDHVEKIVIIDSIVVDKAEFFKHYKIAPSIGKFTETQDLPNGKLEEPTFVFSTEGSEKMMWIEKDSTDVTRLMETSRLIDGTWEPNSKADDILNNNGEIAYPFMMPDGSTLYYACNGDGSIGGYDIYMSRKNLDDGSYLQPLNVGMPYNSPFDDYLLVIDESTGIGWWATDRNQIPGKVTIYVFIPNEVRENYDSTDENICSFAKVNSIKDTWKEGEDYSEYFEKLASVGNVTTKKKKEFTFEVKKGVVYTCLDDAKSSEGRQYLEQYIASLKNYNQSAEKLKALRKTYSDSGERDRVNLKREILSLEKSMLKESEELMYLKNSVIKAERRKIN